MMAFGQSNLPSWLLMLASNQEVKLEIDWRSQAIVVHGLEGCVRPWNERIKLTMHLSIDGNSYSYTLHLLDKFYNLSFQEVAASFGCVPDISLDRVLNSVHCFSMEDFSGFCDHLVQLHFYIKQLDFDALQPLVGRLKSDYLPIEPATSHVCYLLNRLIDWLCDKAIVVVEPGVELIEEQRRTLVEFSFSVAPIGVHDRQLAVDMAFRFIEMREHHLETVLKVMSVMRVTKTDDQRIHLRFAASRNLVASA